jgi:pseudouridine kinase
MTKREEEIFKLIQDNPLISQQEIATILGISRSAVAGHIASLMAKGFINGKGYIIKKDTYVVVIGGSNIDISGSPDSTYIKRDSNPGTITFSPGGVGRNIAENLARMGTVVKLLSVVGNDLHGKMILQESRGAGIDMNHVMIIESEPTSAYLFILDEKKDMISAVSDMSIINRLDKSYIEKNNGVIMGSSLIIIDANLSQDVIKHIVLTYKHKDIFIDTVSSVKAKKIKKFVGNFHTVKPNAIEAEQLSGISINSIDDMKKAAMILLDKGVKKIFLTMGEKGILYTDRKQSILYEKKPVKAVNATGAGDAFTAGLAYSYMAKSSIKETLDFATAASELTVLHPKTINTNLSLENIIKQMKERI